MRFGAAHDATVAAMREGAEIVYQATFSREGWRGRADFLVRVDEPSELGDWSYEPHDTKLARSAKPAAVLQLAWYADEVAAVQGRQPERVHVVLGTREVETYRPADVDAYLRTAQRRLRAARRGAARHLPVALRALLALRVHLRLSAAVGGRRPPHAGRLDPARPDRGSSRRSTSRR